MARRRKLSKTPPAPKAEEDWANDRINLRNELNEIVLRLTVEQAISLQKSLDAAVQQYNFFDYELRTERA